MKIVVNNSGFLLLLTLDRSSPVLKSDRQILLPDEGDQ